MAGPWDQFQDQPPTSKPWEKFSAPADTAKPWDKFKGITPPSPQAAPAQATPTFTASDAFSRFADTWQRGSDQYKKDVPDIMSLKNLPTTWKDTPGLETAQGFGPLELGRMIPPAAKAVKTALTPAMQTVEKVFSPDTVDAAAREAAGSIRASGGQAARDTATTSAAIEPFWKMVNAAPDAERLQIIDYVEGRSSKYAGTTLQDARAMALANVVKDEFEKRMTRLQQLPSTQQASFIDDYFPHFWKDPKAAQTFVDNFGGMSRQGSAASLKKRTMPTIADGIAAGLQPISTNPLEMTMRYVTSMDRFIAATEVLDTAKASGTVRWLKPQVMGASGNPSSFKIPPGYVKLEGRATSRGDGSQAYAPEGFARVYNNWISRGIGEVDPAYGHAYDTIRHGSNSITALELGLSGYHALTMMQEGVVNQVASALGYARRGHFGTAATKLAGAPAAPVSLAMKGKKLQDVYLGLTPGARDMQEVTNLLTKAGGRAKGAQHAPDYQFSQTGSYVTALKRGALQGQLLVDKNEALSGVGGTARVAFRHMGRIIDTVAQPIFEKYIPVVKNGAFYENMSGWLKQNPGATEAQKTAAARQIWDSVDNRFGEMVSDNVFWNQVLKQTAQLSLRSWSWTMGTSRELGGGVRDAIRAPYKTPTGIGPNDAKWTQKMDYAVALPLTYAALAATYQYLKTGQPPKDLQDLAAPRTGGTDAATGEAERIIMPGYMKDVFGFLEHPVQEAGNKFATAPTKAVELMENKDWRGDPIFPPSGSDAPAWLSAFWNYATDSFGPISMKDIVKGRREGSNLNRFEKALGVRTAPRYLTDPNGFTQMMDRIDAKKWRGKQRHDERQKSFYED